MNSEKLIRKAVTIAAPILLISAAIDTALWFTTGYTVPCLAVAALSAGTAIILLCTRKLIDETQKNC